MRISTKGRYALRLMVDLAINNKGELVTIKSIAKRQNISDKYLEQIISVLCRSGFVISSRGAQGGYRLAKNAKDYSVGMILRSIEGSLAPVACIDDNECTRFGFCACAQIYSKVYEAINDVVDNITLADLVEKQKEMNEKYNK